MLTQQEAQALVLRSPFDRRPMSDAFIADRAARRAMRRACGHKINKDDWVGLWSEMPPPMAGGASFFNIVIDTTAPAGVTLALNGNATATTSRDITAAIGTTDSPTTGYQVLIWGDVDNAFNASIQSTQGASAWITPGAFPANQAVRLSTGDGSKTINIRVRDDVWNESATVSKSITLDTVAPTVDITTGPDATKLSHVSGKRVTNFTFTVGSEPIVAWEVAVVANGTSARGTGTVIGTANGSTNTSGGALAANAAQSVSLDARDISAASAGDGTKVVRVYVQDSAGNWSTV